MIKNKIKNIEHHTKKFFGRFLTVKNKLRRWAIYITLYIQVGRFVVERGTLITVKGTEEDKDTMYKILESSLQLGVMTKGVIYTGNYHFVRNLKL